MAWKLYVISTTPQTLGNEAPAKSKFMKSGCVSGAKMLPPEWNAEDPQGLLWGWSQVHPSTRAEAGSVCQTIESSKMQCLISLIPWICLKFCSIFMILLNIECFVCVKNPSIFDTLSARQWRQLCGYCGRWPHAITWTGGPSGFGFDGIWWIRCNAYPQQGCCRCGVNSYSLRAKLNHVNQSIHPCPKIPEVHNALSETTLLHNVFL